MNQNKKIKLQAVEEIVSKIKKAKCFIVVEYSGLTVQNLQKLRKELKKHKADAKVYKNRLFKIAVEKTNFKEIAKELIGPNIFVFGSEDEFVVSKIIAEFAKTNDKIQFKIGTFENKVVDAEMLKQIAALPSLEEAHLKLAFSLLAPIQYLGMGLHMLSQQNVTTERKTN